MREQRSIEGLQEWLYLVIAFALAIYLVIGVIAWTWMILADVEVPAAFGTVLAAIVGSLAGILSPLRPPGTSRTSGRSGDGREA
jgi:hypothetical protein